MISLSLIIVDVQNDFCPGGALAVPKGDEVVAVINKLLEDEWYSAVVATQDWHPAGHKSFASSHPGKAPYDVIDLNGLPQVLWPDHCIQGSKGAEIRNDLEMRHVEKVFQKGADPEVDSYSGFFDNGGRNPSGLAEYLKEQHARNLHIVGLATDYCVRATALDAIKLGFRVTLVQNACRAVGVKPADEEAALKEMAERGVHLWSSV